MVIKNLMKKMIRWAFEDSGKIPYLEDQPVSISSSKYSSNPSRIGDNSTGMNITVYSATGGQVIQFNRYDPTRDRVTGGLYVVTDQEDLGEELGLIITREQLSR